MKELEALEDQSVKEKNMRDSEILLENKKSDQAARLQSIKYHQQTYNDSDDILSTLEPVHPNMTITLALLLLIVLLIII